MAKLLKVIFRDYMQKFGRKRLQENEISEGKWLIPNLSIAGIILLFSSTDYIPVVSFWKFSKISGH